MADAAALPNLGQNPAASVLLVDDHPANLLALRALLDGLDCDLVDALSGPEALRKLQDTEFAVVLLDVLMPGMSGFETAQRLRSQEAGRHTPVMFLTAADLDRAQLEEGYALGAVDFLLKPLVPVILQAKVRGFVELFRDKLRARREGEQLRLLVQSATDYAIFILDPDGRVATWNAGAERIKGYAAEEIIGQHFSRFYPAEAVARGWPAHELAAARAEGRFEDEGWRVRKDGTQFWANVVITALRDERGELRGFSKITRDLTIRKQAEEAARHLVEETTARRMAEENARLIRAERERLHVTLASIGDGVISTDAEGRVTFLNPVAEAMVGWTAAEAARRALSEVFRIVNEGTRQPVENPALRALREGVIVGLANHTLLIARDGTERPIDDSAAPIRDADNHVVGSVLVFRDVAAQKKAERHRTARNAVTQVLNQAPTVDDGIGGTLRAVCETLRWDVGLYWAVAADGAALVSGPGWHGADAALASFDAVSRRHTFTPGQGLPGRVWASGRPAWIPDVSRADNLPRQADAQAHGLRSAFACPVAIGARTLGVIEFFSRRPRVTDADLVEMMGTVADSVGQFIERKRAELALRESERRFRQLADAMPQIVWSATAAGDVDYLNRRWTEFTGLPETASNDAWNTILHAAEAGPAAERWAKSLASGAPFEMEVRLLDRRRQAYRWHLLRTVAVRDDAGRVARWFGTGTDIDEQKRAEESARYLAAASAALAGVVDTESTLQKVVNLAVPYFADWAAIDVAANGGLRRLAVAHQDAEKVRLAHELAERYPSDLTAEAGIAAVFRTGKPELVGVITDDMLANGARDERHLELLRTLGLKSYLCVPLTVAGATFGILTFATAESGRAYTADDLTLAADLAHRAAVAVENTRLYEALREADRRKDEFLAMLAHELRNPLAPIRNALQILKMPHVDAATVERSRAMMERQVHHLVRLVDDLLDVSRVMRGKIDLRRERVELAAVVARAVETAQPLVDAQGHQLRVQLPTESLPVDADPVRLTQVVGNLLTNAAKYTERGGHITLTAERAGGIAVLRVRDTGIGIAPDLLPRIFELFVQADATATRAQGGLGIGLTLVKSLVEMHHGTVEAHSAGPGQGSEFIVRLPLATRAASGATRPEELAVAASSSGRRLLVIDDNQDAANSLAVLLRLLGHEVRVAYGGAVALEVTKTYFPDVVFLDIGMPGMDGYEVARRLRQQPGLERTVLAALTGWGQQEDRRRTSEAGFDHHLVKPPDLAAVESLLAELPRPQ